MRVLLFVRGRTSCTKPHLALRCVTGSEALLEGQQSGLTGMAVLGVLGREGGLEVYSVPAAHAARMESLDRHQLDRHAARHWL